MKHYVEHLMTTIKIHTGPKMQSLWKGTAGTSLLGIKESTRTQRNYVKISGSVHVVSAERLSQSCDSET